MVLLTHQNPGGCNHYNGQHSQRGRHGPVTCRQQWGWLIVQSVPGSKIDVQLPRILLNACNQKKSEMHDQKAETVLRPLSRSLMGGRVLVRKDPTI